MKITKIENRNQKMIITGLIVSDNFCKQIMPILLINKDLSFNIFSGIYRIVLNWSINYYKKYEKAIYKHIQNIYNESYNRNEFKEEDYKLLSTFLFNLSNDFEKQKNYNERYVIDQAKIFLRKSNLELLRKNIENAVGKENLDKAENFIDQFRQIENTTSTIDIVDVINDTNIINSVLNEEDERLFRFHGALGDLIGYFLRGDLVSFSAPGKGGKSHWLFETAINALLGKLRVAIFSFEMPRNQCLRRLYKMFVGEVNNVPDGCDYVDIEVPYFDRTTIINVKKKKVKKYGLRSRIVKKKLESLKTMLKGGSLMLITPPSYSMTVKGATKILDNFAINGNPVDVVIFDYADIMLSDNNKDEHRNKINTVWQALRRLAHEKNCLVVTATHSNKSSYNDDQSQESIVEDIRKLNHVAMNIALNQNDYDRENGVIRAAILVHRHKHFSKKKQVVILHNYDIGKPYLDSRYLHKINYKTKRKKKE